MVIGIAGKKKSGKTLLANFLCARYGAVKVSFASSLKGLLTPSMGILAWRPQMNAEARLALQSVGQGCRDVDEDAFTRLWNYAAPFISGKVIVPDVRYANEFAVIKERGGNVIGLRAYKTEDATDMHPSELVPLDLADIVIEVDDPYEERQEIFRQADEFLRSEGYEPSGEPPLIYIASNITNKHGFEDSFKELAWKVKEAGFEPLIPTDVPKEVWYEGLERETIKELAKKLVAGDLKTIASAHGVLAYFDAPSFGGAMEILSAALMEKPVAIVVPLNLLYHPWLHAFGKMFWDDVDEAIRWLASCLTLTT